MVSDAGPDKAIDYVIGAYYEKTQRYGSWYVTIRRPGARRSPGMYAAGCDGTLPGGRPS